MPPAFEFALGLEAGAPDSAGAGEDAGAGSTTCPSLFTGPCAPAVDAGAGSVGVEFELAAGAGSALGADSALGASAGAAEETGAGAGAGSTTSPWLFTGPCAPTVEAGAGALDEADCELPFAFPPALEFEFQIGRAHV